MSIAPGNGLISKIGDYLENRIKATNFGTCKRCDKKVYWSTTKVASHIRSGHCSGATEDEIARFKVEFIYDSPKNLVHKSSLKNVTNATIKRKLSKSNEKEVSIKKQREDSEVVQEHYVEDENNDDQSDHIMYEVEGGDDANDEKLEIVYVQEDFRLKRDSETSEASTTLSKDDKFIAAVYPQFKGKTKLQLIDEILDLKRQNELLQGKVKTYEKTIHSLL